MTMPLRPGICINWLSSMKIVNTVIWAKKFKFSEYPIEPGKVQKTISNCLFADLGLNLPPKFFFESFLDNNYCRLSYLLTVRHIVHF